MPSDAANPASAAARTGSGDIVCFGGEHVHGSRKFSEHQANNNHISCAPMRCGQIKVLRLVPPPRPRRIEVRFAAADARAPIGRTRIFRLTESDLERLIDHAVRLESRA